MNAPTPNPGKRFAGGLLIAVGGMIFLMCGLCTAGVVGTGVDALFVKPGAGDEARYDAAWSPVFLVLAPVVGGVPTMVGLAILALGVSEFHSRPSPNRDRLIGGGFLMGVGAAVALTFGAMGAAAILEAIHDLRNRGPLLEPVLTAIVLIGIVAGAVGLFWKGLKMVRSRAPEK